MSTGSEGAPSCHPDQVTPALTISVDVTDGLLAAPAVAQVVRDVLQAVPGAACALDGSGRVAAVNQQWERRSLAIAVLPGVGVHAGTAWQRAADAGDPVSGVLLPALHEVLAGDVAEWSASCAGPSPDGERWVGVRLSRLAGVGGALLQLTDTTADAVAARRSRHLACHDALTGLPNRALLLERLQGSLDRVRATRGQVAVVHVDLVSLDAPGSGATATVDLRDGAVAAAAQRLCAAVGEGDTVARVGDGQFVVVCEGVGDEVEARHLATGLRAAVLTGGRSEPELELQAAVGVALGGDDETATALLEAAAPGMRPADGGVGGVRVFSASMRVEAARRARIARDLRTAVARGELRVDYQPLVDVATSRVDKAEALLRWRHPELGELSPAEFVPIAEETGAIVDIGAWVVETACRWLASRGGEDRLCVSVNLSAQQLGDDAVVALVADRLAENRLDASRLVLEVTESAVVADRERSTAVLRDLRALGVGLALDDFGTGYSSLVYLRDFPFDTLKIDRRFVAGLGVDDDDTAIVASVVDLAHAVGMVAVAEGVESADQLHLLRQLGCDLAQGWLWAPAVPDDELDVVLAALALVPARGRDDAARLQASARERRLRDRARQLQAQGASLHTIAAALNGEGLLTSRGTRWSVQSAAHLVAGLRATD